DNCKCSQPLPSDKTHWGQENVIIKEDRVFKALHGKIVSFADNEPLRRVLVEVYDHPEGLLLGWKDREAGKAKQRRIAACITGEDGEFCFSNIPPGQYELCCSKPSEWNCTSVYVVVAPEKSGSVRSEIVILMHLSQ